MTTLKPHVDSAYITVKLTPNQARMLWEVATHMEEGYVEWLEEFDPMSGADHNSLRIARGRLLEGLQAHGKAYPQ